MRFQKKNCDDVVAAPVKGETVSSSKVSDPVFSEEMLGKGMAIQPAEGKVYAPFDGMITMVFDTRHAVSLVSEKGMEILIHVGLDTVALNGRHYKNYVESGQAVKKGDLLLEFEMEAIKADGYDVITPIVVCNTEDYKDVVCVIGKKVDPGDVIMELMK